MLQKIDNFRWRIPRSFRKEMRAEAIVYGSENIIKSVGDEALKQLTNVACLPGVKEPVVAMPDIHWGYGLPMGAVGAFDAEKGIISAGMTGFDINCGIRLIKTNKLEEDMTAIQKELLISRMFEKIPAGVGGKGGVVLSDSQLDEVMKYGAIWAVENGYGTKDDLLHMEEGGNMAVNDISVISQKARTRGKPQLGTLGAGNHFVEIQKVDTIYDETAAKAFGINEINQIMIMVHSGSRGFGHQIATDYLQILGKAAKKYNIWLPDPQLVCAPATSQEGQAYFEAMKCGVNFAFANRTMIMNGVREAFQSVFQKDWKDMGMDLLYDVCHNICKLEKHKGQDLYIHRKGATRAFGPGQPAVPAAYRDVGQPVLIAGSMGTASYVLVGTQRAMDETYGSTCHGAGRNMSRHAAIKKFYGEDIKSALGRKGIVAKSTHPKVLAEEAPSAYKDVDEVVRSVHEAGISTMVARMVPLAVMKG